MYSLLFGIMRAKIGKKSIIREIKITKIPCAAGAHGMRK
jgi:hypothetical protein